MKKTLLFSAIAAIISTNTALAVELDPLTPEQRHHQAYVHREMRANVNYDNHQALHPTNSDEMAVPDFYGQFHKSLPHSDNGKVDSEAYQQLLNAIETGTFAAFEQVPTGGPVKLANPLAAQVYDLEGRDNHDYGTKPAPTLGSAEAAAEMVEVYAQALMRDIPFNQYTRNKSIMKIAAELANLRDFYGPTSPTMLFRGIFEGDQVGPHISQFLYKDIPAGPKVINQKYTRYKAGENFMTAYNEWLAIQNGQNPSQSLTNTTDERYLMTGRDLAR